MPCDLHGKTGSKTLILEGCVHNSICSINSGISTNFSHEFVTVKLSTVSRLLYL